MLHKFCFKYDLGIGCLIMAVINVYCNLAQFGLIIYILCTWHNMEDEKLGGITDPNQMESIKDSLKVCNALYIGIIAFAACSVVVSLMLIFAIWKRIPDLFVIFMLFELFAEIASFILQIILFVKDSHHYVSLILTLVIRLFDIYYIIVAFSYYLKLVNEQFFSLESVNSTFGKHLVVQSPEDAPKNVKDESKPAAE